MAVEMKENAAEQANLNAVEESAKKNAAEAGKEFDKMDTDPNQVELYNKFMSAKWIVDKWQEGTLTAEEFYKLADLAKEFIDLWIKNGFFLWPKSNSDIEWYNKTLWGLESMLTVILNQQDRTGFVGILELERSCKSAYESVNQNKGTPVGAMGWPLVATAKTVFLTPLAFVEYNLEDAKFEFRLKSIDVLANFIRNVK